MLVLSVVMEEMWDVRVDVDIDVDIDVGIDIDIAERVEERECGGVAVWRCSDVVVWGVV